MKNALTMNVRGIKCDNPKCDFEDMEVPFSDYEKWLNKPCPKCRHNLLTEQDFNTTKLLMDLTGIINEGIPQAPDDESMCKMSVDMNGNGKAVFSKIEPYLISDSDALRRCCKNETIYKGRSSISNRV